MTSDQVAATAYWTAAVRAAEHNRADRLFADPYAARLAGREGLELYQKGIAEHPEASVPYLPIRHRFLDDFLASSLTSDPAVRQVVLLGAGLDARAFRLAWPAGTHLYELDRADLLDRKERILEKTRPRCTRHVIGTDLAGQWGGLLAAAGFDAAAPSIWILEGLLTYLDEPDVHRVLATVEPLAAPGSLLGADLVNQVFLEHPYLREFLALMAEFGAPWRFGTNDPERLFARHGWQAIVIQPGDDGAHFGRWPFPRHAPGDDGAPRGWLVRARRSG